MHADPAQGAGAARPSCRDRLEQIARMDPANPRAKQLRSLNVYEPILLCGTTRIRKS